MAAKPRPKAQRIPEVEVGTGGASVMQLTTSKGAAAMTIHVQRRGHQLGLTATAPSGCSNPKALTIASMNALRRQKLLKQLAWGSRRSHLSTTGFILILMIYCIEFNVLG